jgi:putative nucleotide binding protein
MSKDRDRRDNNKYRRKTDRFDKRRDHKSYSHKKFEEYVIVLDYLPRGHIESRSRSFKTEPIIQSVGTNYFTLLELVPRKSYKSKIKVKDKLYIGPETREMVDHIKGRISYDELTANAKFELEDTIKKVIKENEERFVEFFNNARPITTRMHQLELFPGVGKKIMWEILNARKKAKFGSFKDISERVSKVPEPESMILKRIISELQGDDKYYIFIRPPHER